MRFGPEISTRRMARRVVIAHGSQATTLALKSMLSGFDGWTVAGVAHKVTQALAVTEVVLPELILLDLGLAGENFVQVIGWMKEKHPSPTIVVLSQNRWGDLRKRCLESGADYFCNESSPNSVAELLQELEPLHWKKGRYGLCNLSP